VPPAKRLYVSPLREQAAARTHAQILQHATELFAERGYGRVTVRDIAEAAGVAPKTVFASVGSKSDILDLIVDQAVGDSGYNETMGRFISATSADAAIRILAAGTRAGNESQLTVIEAVFKALPVHENGEALWLRTTGDYRAALRAAAEHLHGLGVPPGYPVPETADLLWFWFGPSAWRNLVIESGWPWDRAEQVLCQAAIAGLYPRATGDSA
jgi:AcrR family transcriptional regulator